MNEDVIARYELALKIISETAPETDSIEDLKKWYANVRLLANNAIQGNPLDMEFEDALIAGSRTRGRAVRLKM